jgi:hypothetical protein
MILRAGNKFYNPKTDFVVNLDLVRRSAAALNLRINVREWEHLRPRHELLHASSTVILRVRKMKLVIGL